ncbi:hypothetical protein AA313_de0200364 [Arthrobotrys entomopaga]|nr:hypothetical protein AA313_de0200364 [Arthrobotrys entomopaga]
MPDKACKDTVSIALGYKISKTVENHIIQKTFRDSQTQWIDNPIIKQWRDPKHQIHDVLTKVGDLYQKWTSIPARPFNPNTDPLWLETGRTLAEIGLPWFNIQFGMPDEIDTSWPFHFKAFEQKVVRTKGARVGDSNASGYITSYGEANCYCIRALQQDLREKSPRDRPILIYDNFDPGLLFSIGQLLGLQLHHISLSQKFEDIRRELAAITDNGNRPVIFAATSAAKNGSYDDLDLICKISKETQLVLHVEASRNFDYMTTLSQKERERLRIPKLALVAKSLHQPLRLHDGSIAASTIVAGGANYTDPSFVAALKPVSLGGKLERVEYIRAFDSTLAGSRDSIPSLWMALQELRFGESGFQSIYQHCLYMRDLLLQALKTTGVSAISPPYSLDVVIRSCSKEQLDRLAILGGIPTGLNDVVITLQPSVQLDDLNSIAAIMSPSTTTPISKAAEETFTCHNFQSSYKVPQSVTNELKMSIQSWKIATRSAAGYPVNMSSCSALGPIVGAFLDVDIPDDWAKVQADSILTSRMRVFGLKNDSISLFKGAFTNGSTMGNRLGIHAALARLPGAFVYFSSDSHYSIIKAVRDCDLVTNRWSERKPRYSQIPSDQDGSMLVDALITQVLADRRYCNMHCETYQSILVVNMGTTFAGGRDALTQIHAKLDELGVTISHIHVDGALDFGFSNCGITLGRPGTVDSHGVPLVQGIIISHHKSLGSVVSGEVICYSPEDQLTSLEWGIDPRVVFETWLYMQAYASADVTDLLHYCQKNARRLEIALRRANVATKRNPGSLIVVLERPPAWIIEEFSLRPEGDWVHFIVMPHISIETIDLFVDRISWAKKQCLAAFSYVNPLMDDIIMQPTKLKLLQCRDALVANIAELSAAAIPMAPGTDGSCITRGVA